MIGQGAGESSIWLQSVILSVAVHAGAGALLVAPAFDFLSFTRDTLEPTAVTLSVMDITPESIEAAIDNQPPAEEVAPEPESPPEPVPEELAAVEPEAETPPEPEPEELAAVAPEPELEPEPIDPVEEMAPEAIAAVDPSQISPINPEGDGGAGIAPVGALDAVAAAPAIINTAIAPEIAAPVAPVAESVAAVQSLPAVAPPSGAPAIPAVQDPEVSQGPPGVVDEFILRIRGQLALPCIVATPRREAAGDVVLEFLAANENDVNAFATDLLSGLAAPPVQRNVLVDPRQCPALNFIREGARYPTFPLAIAVEETTVTSGGRLIGALQGAQGRFVTLIVVDDNGVVQDLAPFLSFSGDTVRFDVPMTRFGPARDTQQILMAVATAGRPAALDTHAGFLAEDFFPALRQTVDRNAPLAMIPFTLR